MTLNVLFDCISWRYFHFSHLLHLFAFWPLNRFISFLRTTLKKKMISASICVPCVFIHLILFDFIVPGLFSFSMSKNQDSPVSRTESGARAVFFVHASHPGTHVPVTHTHAHTYDGARDSYSHMYTECVNKHTWANTSMSPHALAARRVYFQMNSLSQCWLRVKNDTWTHRSYCTHTYCKKEKRKPMTTKPHCKTRAMTEFSPQKSKHV